MTGVQTCALPISAAQQDAFAGYAGWNATEHAPGQQEGETQCQGGSSHPVERACDADNMVELFGIRKPLDGRFPKNPLRSPFHTAPANTEATSAGLDLAGMLSFLQVEIASPRGQRFNRHFFEPKPSVCSRPVIRADRLKRNDRRPARGIIGRRKGSATSKTIPLSHQDQIVGET